MGGGSRGGMGGFGLCGNGLRGLGQGCWLCIGGCIGWQGLGEMLRGSLRACFGLCYEGCIASGQAVLGQDGKENPSHNKHCSHS